MLAGGSNDEANGRCTSFTLMKQKRDSIWALTFCIQKTSSAVVSGVIFIVKEDGGGSCPFLHFM